MGYSTLVEAIGRGDAKRLRQLVRADPADARHWKPIMDAAFAGRADLVEILLDAGADPNARSGTAARHTPLVRVMQRHETIPRHEGHDEVVQLLLQRGADPNLPAGPFGLPPLGYAAHGGFTNFIDALLAHGVRLDLHLHAMLCNRAQLARGVARPGVCAERDPRGRTLLHCVAFSGLWQSSEKRAQAALACATLLLSAGAEVDSVQEIPDGEEVFQATPLWLAVAWQGHTALAAFLLEAGASPNPAVFAAAFRGEIAILELLDGHGADWNLRFGGRTPLLDLLHWKRPAALPWLLAHGADPNLRDPEGRTALHLAVLRGVKSTFLGTLLQGGAKRNLKDADGKTPLDLARAQRNAKAITALST